MKQRKTKTLLLATGIILVLVAIMIVTVVRLKQLATVPVAPTAPSSKPKAAEVISGELCQTTFTLAVAACGITCTEDAQCGAGLSCQDVSGTKKCVNPSCATDDDCVCPNASPSPSPSPSPTPEPDKCNIECNPNSGDTGCSDGYVCEPNSRRCRKPACVDQESCTCKVDSCNTTCNPNVQAQDSGCTDGLVCEPNSRRCRKPTCTGEEDCVCSTTTPTPRPTSTPTNRPTSTASATIIQAGNSIPSILFVTTGGILVLLGVLAASML